MSVQLAKATLRKELKIRLRNISLEEKISQSRNVTEKVLKSDVYRKSERISIYLSTEDEVSTKDILFDILARGKQCFIPRYTSNQMEMLRLYSIEDYESLPLTKWKIKQPADNDTSREDALTTGGLDLVVLPGLGFTSQGVRIGHGKGYYDIYLEKLKNQKNQKTQTNTIALAFKEQILEHIPTTEQDKLIDHIFYSDD